MADSFVVPFSYLDGVVNGFKTQAVKEAESAVTVVSAAAPAPCIGTIYYRILVLVLDIKGGNTL